MDNECIHLLRFLCLGQLLGAAARSSAVMMPCRKLTPTIRVTLSRCHIIPECAAVMTIVVSHQISSRLAFIHFHQLNRRRRGLDKKKGGRRETQANQLLALLKMCRPEEGGEFLNG
jgi:hypothetical protein